MKRSCYSILFFALALLFYSCQRGNNTLAIHFSRAVKTDSTSVKAFGLTLKKNDSVYHKDKIPFNRDINDTLRLDSLTDGKYTLHYYNILGKEIVKDITLSGDEVKQVNIVPDSINTVPFYDKAPIVTLNDGQSYLIDMRGGCIAAFHFSYKVTKKVNTFYIDSYDLHHKKMTADDIRAVRKFESEILAIQTAKSNCNSTADATFRIIRQDTISIKDHSCCWNGLSQMMRVLLKK